MIESMCDNLLNTAYKQEHKRTTVAFTNATARSAGAVGMLLYRCCC